MKVAITDYTFADLEIEKERLEAIGAEVVCGQCKTPEKLIALVEDVDAVITQFAPVSAEVIQRMNKAQVIVRYGVGYDNVDLKAARAKDIPVCNVPDFCVDEVADHTLGFILNATRNLQANSLKVRRGEWGLAVPLGDMRTLRNCSVGIVGFGRIGQAVAARLEPFKCHRLVFDPVVDPAVITDARCHASSLDDLLADSDIVTLHCPSNENTRNLLNAESIGRMKKGAILINVGRGDLVDPNALVAALQSGALSGAGLDVFNPEPVPSDSPLRTMDNVMLSAHIASASLSAVTKLRETAAEIACLALQGEELPNVVN